ncbi:MAG: hypothetical protein R3E64_03990 [Halioglobus sp.]
MISAATLRQIAHTHGQLLYMALSPEVRLCSYGALNVLGDVWGHGDFGVAAIEVGQQGVEAITITLGDLDHAWAQRMRAEFVPGIVCEWHLLYRGRTEWETDLVFSGALERPRITGKGEVQIDAQVASADTAVVPRIPHESPWSLARGTQIVLNGTTYTVE